MSNDFNIIYSFLAKFGGKDAWVDKADTNDDEVVTINEFRTLIDSNWDKNTMGKLPENDLINRFFRNFDTNNSGANKDRIQTGKGSVSNLYAWSSSEHDKMDNKVEIFVKINEVLASDTSISNKASEIFGTNLYGNAYTEWLTAVKNEVMNKLAECKPEEITSKKVTEVINSPEMNKMHAKYGAQAYIEEVGKNYADLVEHGYDISKDASLNGLINSLIEQGTNLDAIKTRINNYLVGKEVDGSETSPITSGQKDLAGARLRKALLEALQSSEEYDSKYKAAYESAVDEYVAQVKKGATKMSEIKDKTVDTFKESDAYTIGLQEKIALQEKVDTVMAEFDNYMNNAISSLENDAIEALIGDDLKNELKEALKNSILNGELEINDIANWLSNQLNVRLEKVFSNGYSGIENKQVQGVHDYRMNVIAKTEYPTTDGRTQDDIRLEYTQNAAIDYCTWLAGKSSEHEAKVQEILGTSDIQSAFKDLKTTNEVTSLLNKVTKACGEIIDTSNIKIKTPDIQNCYTNQKYEFGITTENPDNVAIAYSVSNIQSGAEVSIDKVSGKITFYTTTADNYSFDVNIVVNNKVIDTKKVTVKASTFNTEDIVNNAEFKNQGTNTASSWVTNEEMTSYSFKNLYNNDITICLGHEHTYAHALSWDTIKEWVRTHLGDTIDKIIPALQKAGLTDETRLAKAQQSVTEYLLKNFNANKKEENFSNFLNKDKTHDQSQSAAMEYAKGVRNNLSSYRNDDGWSEDEIFVCIQFRDLVDMLIKAYNNGGIYA